MSARSHSRCLAIFCAALAAGWMVRQRVPTQATRPAAAPPRAAAPLDVAKLATVDCLHSRMLIAEALVDADAAGLARIAEVFLTAKQADARAWSAIFGCWMRLAPAAAWGFARRQAEPVGDMNLTLIALQQWAALDPQEARRVLDAPDASQYSALIRGALQHDVEGGFRLLDEALGTGVDVEEGALGGTCFVELARVDPPAAVAWTERLNLPGMLLHVLLGWVERSPAEAREWLEQRLDGADILTGSVGLASISRDAYRPELMNAFMSLIPPGKHKNDLVQEVLEVLAGGEPDFALKEALRLLAYPSARAEVIGAIASVMAKHDFSKALEILSLVEPPAPGTTRLENAADSEWLAAGPCPYPNRGAQEIKLELLERLIEVDKDDALRQMEKLTAEELGLMQGEGIREWAKRDPEEAATWLARKLGHHGELTSVICWFMNMEMHGEPLRELVSSLPHGTVRTALAIAAADDIFTSDPAAALQFARESATSTEVADRVYQSWIARDPKDALARMAADPDASPAAWQNAVDNTFGKFPAETTAAMAALPPGNARDAAVLAMVKKSTAASDPLPLVTWALSIDEENSRENALEAVFTRIGLDLRLAGDAATAAALREALRHCEHLVDSERNRWLERLNREVAHP